jgi:hypothetical protein
LKDPRLISVSLNLLHHYFLYLIFQLLYTMSDYRAGKSWSASGGTYYNGHGAPIAEPKAYFSAVADNKHGYNSSYTTGKGESIAAPKAYFSAVGTCIIADCACAPNRIQLV